MPVISIADAKKLLSALIERAAAGERIEIDTRGRALVALVPAVAVERGITFGTLAGKLVIPPDVDAPLPEGVLEDCDGDDR
jgi:prevent-host-death family protein